MASASKFEQMVAIVGNITPSVMLILLNKILVKTWNFPLTLTLMHMIFLSISMHIAAKLGFFKPKEMCLKQIIMVAFSGIGSIAFMNLSLAWNSVGVYQLSKLACIPCTVFVQTVWHKMHFPMEINLSLVVVMLGIGITTVTDVQFNFAGTMMGILAVLSTTQYQIWIGSKQKELDMNQFQMLHRVAPAMAVLSLLSLPFTECTPSHSVFNAVFSPRDMTIALASCVAAVAVNFSTYLLIHRTSVVTYLVVGHVKTILILLAGVLLLDHYEPDPWNLLGICMSMFGVILYGYLKNRSQSQTEKTK